VRTFYSEVRVQPKLRKRGRWLRDLVRWATALFAVVCLSIDAGLVRAAPGHVGTYETLLRIVLLEIEAYLAIVVILMTVRISVEPRRRDERRAGRRR
jgi:hypothetical protein